MFDWWGSLWSGLVVGFALGVLACCTAYFSFSGTFGASPDGKGFDRQNAPLSRNLWAEPTGPDGGIIFDVDTTVVDTQMVVLPDFLFDGSLEKDTTIHSPRIPANRDKPDIIVDGIKRDRNLQFLAIPTVDGKPTLDITPDVVTGSFYDPETGRGLEYNWNIPSYKNRVGFSATGIVTISDRTYLSGYPSLFFEHKNYRLDVGYNLSSEPLVQGFRFTISYENVLFRF